MANMIGMDVEQVRALSKLLETKANEIESAMRTISQKLQGTTWKGNDATQFTSHWTGTLTKQLNTVIDALKDASRKARDNAQRQEDTSRDL